MSQALASEEYYDRLEEAKNIALGWRIVGLMPPETLEEAIQMLRDSAEMAAQVCDLLGDELREARRNETN